MTPEAAQPRPTLPPTEISRFYWDAARAHKLLIQRCDDCGHYIHWPQVSCPVCQSERLSPAEVSGKGTIYSFTIVHHLFHPAFADEVPYSLAIIELNEQPGLRLLTNIVDCPNDELSVGMPVEVTFQDQEGATLPQFKPVNEASTKAKRP